MKKKYLKKMQVLLLSGVLAAGSLLYGCGGSENEEQVTEHSSDQEEIMGRYLETELSLPQEDLMVQAVTQLEDGTLRGSFSDTAGNYTVYDTNDQGQSWKEAVDLHTILGLNEYRSVQKMALSRQGEIYAGVVARSQEDPESYICENYLVKKDGTAVKLEADKKEDSLFVWQALFARDGTLYLEVLGGGVQEYKPGKPQVEKVYEEGKTAQGMGVIGNTLLLIVDLSVHYYDRTTKEPVQDEKALTEQITAKKENMEVVASSSYPILFLEGTEEDKLFYANREGMFCYQPGGAIVEEVIDGELTSLKSPDYGLVDGVCLDDGGFLLGIFNNSKGKLLRYTYSMDISARPEVELTVYSMGDSNLLKQAAALYQKENPNVLVQVQAGLNGEDALTPSDAQKNLNTEIMAGKGPDILLLDGFNVQPYMEKGLLADVSQLLESCPLLENIKGAYKSEDGAIYRMPTGFGIPLKFARSQDLARIGDLASLADYVEELAQEETGLEFYIGPYVWAGSAQILGRRMAKLYTGTWLKPDGTLDPDQIRDFLEQCGRIYATADHEGERQMRLSQEEMYEDIWQSYILETNTQDVFQGHSLMECGAVTTPREYVEVSTALGYVQDYDFDLWDLEKGFIPFNVVAINNQSKNLEEAQDFYKFLFSDTVQRLKGRNGIAVNQNVYEDMKYWGYGTNDFDMEQFSSSDPRTGESTYFSYVQPGQEEISRIQGLGLQVTKRLDQNEFLCEAAANGLELYVHGDLSLEEATDKIMKEVNLYLAE